MENKATTKTPIPTRSGFRNFALCTCLHPDPLGLISAFSISLPSTLVETPLQIALFFAKQSQCQNGQYKHKYSRNKGLCQRTTNNEQRTPFKTNPIKPNFKRGKPISNAVQWCEKSHPTWFRAGGRRRSAGLDSSRPNIESAGDLEFAGHAIAALFAAGQGS